jgi:hypothetical protein
MTNVTKFPTKKTPQEDAMRLLSELAPDAMFVVAAKDGETFMLSSFDDPYIANYLLDQIKFGIFTGDMDYEDS